MNKLEHLIKEEERHRRLSQMFQDKAEKHKDWADEIMLEIIAENKKRARPQEQY